MEQRNYKLKNVNHLKHDDDNRMMNFISLFKIVTTSFDR